MVIADADGFFSEWVQRLRGLADPPARRVVGVVLRGSYARGAATVYSDVDFDVLLAGPPYSAYPAYLVEKEGRLIHVSVAVRDAESWLDRIGRPVPWSFGFPAAAAARLLWADEGWHDRLDMPETAHPASDPELEDFVADLGKVAGAAASGDELGLRQAAAALARLCPSVLRLVNPPVTVGCRREALEAALNLPIAPASYKQDMLACLGLQPLPAAEVAAASRRLVTGTVALIRTVGGELADATGPDFAAAVTDGRLDRYVAQLSSRWVGTAG